MVYGEELIIDMSGCNVSKFTRKDIRLYFKKLCELIDMKAEAVYFWDDYRVPKAQKQTNPKTKGITAVQFILTSNITIHTLDILKTVYVNIFSCKPYNSHLAELYTVSYFSAEKYKSTLLERGNL